MRIKLDLILDAVIAKRREVTFDCDGYAQFEIKRIIDTATARGLDAAFDGRFILVRDLRVVSL
jgi:hypothetical protein